MEHRAGDAKIDANYPVARRLVEAYPEKAIELIVRTCEYHQIGEAIAVAGHAKSPHAPTVNARNQYSALEAPFSSSSSASSQHSASPKSPAVTARYPRSRANTSAALPPSPAPTSSTGQSSTRPDYIKVPIGVNKECQLSMRKFPTEHSLIRQSIVERRLSGHYEVEQIPNGPIHSPFQGAPNGVLTSFLQIELVWRREPSWKTHMATVYLVQEDIDSDILLGEADSGEALATTMGAQSRGQHGTVFQPEMRSPHPQRSFNPHICPPAPGAPFAAASYHRSSHMQESPNRTPTSALHHGSNHDQSFNISNTHFGHQAPQDLPFHARSRPLSRDTSPLRGQPTSGLNPPLSQVHVQGSDPEELRVELTWDKISSPIKLDLNAPAENFLLTIDKKFRRYKKVLSRDDTYSLRFTARKGADECYDMSVVEKDLVDDWISAMEWVRDNRATKAPHVFVVVELNEVDGG